ncbi:arylsulfatase, partial [Gemmatimonadota bacterium]
ALSGKKQQEHEYLYWEFHEGRASRQAVRMGQWKAVRLSPSAAPELYNLSADIGETENVAGDYPEVLKKIEACLKATRAESEYWPLVDKP